MAERRPPKWERDMIRVQKMNGVYGTPLAVIAIETCREVFAKYLPRVPRRVGRRQTRRSSTSRGTSSGGTTTTSPTR